MIVAVWLLQARAKEAEERSRKILEEEQAREAAWRQAVLKVCCMCFLWIMNVPVNCLRSLDIGGIEKLPIRVLETPSGNVIFISAEGCVLQGNVGARRARYEATWHTFVTAIAGGKKGLKYADIPWPAEDPDDARAIILYGTTTPAEVCTPYSICLTTPLLSLLLLLTHDYHQCLRPYRVPCMQSVLLCCR